LKTPLFNIIDLSINDIPISKIDIVGLHLYVSIDSLASKLKLAFYDRGNIIGELPLKGGETVNLIIEDKYGTNISRSFILTEYRLAMKNDQSSFITEISALSETGFLMATDRIYKSWANKKPSDIVFDLNDTIEIEPTSNTLEQFVCPGWTVVKALQKLTELSYSDKYKSPYLCFENTSGDILYTPVNKLLEVNKVNAYKPKNANPFYRYNILDMKQISNFDVLGQSFENPFKNKYISYNPDKKDIETTDVLSDELIGNDVKALNKGSIYSNQLFDLVNVRQNVIPWYDYDTFIPQTINKAVYGLYEKRIDLLLNGDLNLNPGDVIFLDIKDNQKLTEFSKDQAGNWMIEKIAFHFTNADFKVKVRLMKESTFIDEKTWTGPRILKADISDF